MRSILYQLKKYQPEKLPAVIDVPDSTPGNIQAAKPITSDELAEIIIRGKIGPLDWPKIRKSLLPRIKTTSQCLKDFVPGKFCELLYPIEVGGIYHCYYKHLQPTADEETTDWFLKLFLVRHDQEQLRKSFEKSVDELTKKLTMCRVCLATYASKADRLNHLPIDPYRKPAAEYIGAQWVTWQAGLLYNTSGEGCSPEQVAAIQEHLTRQATVEQIILGRMGYLIIWYWDKSTSQKCNVPLLTSS